MRIGLFTATTSGLSVGLKDLVAFARDAEARGVDTLWLPNIFGMDGLGACAIAGWEAQQDRRNSWRSSD